MAKVCPITKERVIYAECMECAEKVCRTHHPAAVKESSFPINTQDNLKTTRRGKTV